MILPPPRNRKQVASYARAINAGLASTPYMQFSVRLPIYDPSVFHPKTSSSANMSMPPSPFSSTTSLSSKVARAPEEDLNGNWEMWDAIRAICDYNPRLTLSEPVLLITCT